MGTRGRKPGMAAVLVLCLFIAPAAAYAISGSSAGQMAGAAPGFAKARAKTHGASKHAASHRAGKTKAPSAKNKREAKAYERPKTARVLHRTTLPLDNAVSAALVASPFTRPGSPERLATEQVGRAPGGFVAWLGPVFWLYAFDDLFEYVFWPSDTSDPEAFWAFAYHDFLTGMFWADGQLANGAEEIVPCDRPVWLSQWPIIRIAQTVGLAREQRMSLKDLQHAASEAARMLNAACPQEVPNGPIARLDAIQQRLAALLAAIESLRPGIDNFYAALMSAQKARFQMPPKPDADGRAVSAGAENQLRPGICTRHLPDISVETMGRIEALLQPTSEQGIATGALRAAIHQAAQTLRAACWDEMPATPADRLAAMRQRVSAMIDGVALVRPPLEALYELLGESQKARLNWSGKQATHFGE